MVQGIPELNARLAAVVPRLDAALREMLAIEAQRIVLQMQNVNPMKETIVIAWTWGRAPSGTMKLGTVQADRTGPRITLYATAFTADYPSGRGFPAIAKWWEFGTAERFQKKPRKSTGAIQARPYFYPVFRANRDGVRRKVRALINKEVRNL